MRGERSQTGTLRWMPLWRGIGWSLILAVWVLSLMPQPPSAPGGDKLHHLLAYFGLMLLFCQWHPRKQHAMLAIALVFMGCAVEVIQPLTGRDFSWLDMLANSTGVMIAWWLAGGRAGTLIRDMKHFGTSGR
jgi:VanZ family protein